MTRKREILIASILFLSVISLASIERSLAQGAQRVPTSTTVPTVTSTSPGVSLGCSPLLALPGSVVTGSSGFVRIRCPNGGAVTLGTNAGITLTPTFNLSPGYVNASIILSQSAGAPCNYRFTPIQSGNSTIPSGVILNGTGLTFTSTPQTGQFFAGVYDYCLQYANAGTLNGFTITWT